MLLDITPVILTFNEENNISRTLGQLSWAKEVVIVDSFSSDDTLAIAAKFPNVRVLQRKFDAHAMQWEFAIRETGIATQWILALDADYFVTEELVNELTQLDNAAAYDAYEASFRWCVFGRILRGTLYPPVTVLFRKEKGKYLQDGHTQRVQIDGIVGKLKAVILHDDRKPLSSWLQAQDKYMRLEANLLNNKKWSELRLADKLRKLIVVAPVVTFLYCLLIKRGMLDGRAGLYYAIQRVLAESILSILLIEKKIRGSDK